MIRAVLILCILSACTAPARSVVITPGPAEEVRSGGLVLTEGMEEPVTANVQERPAGCGPILSGGAGYCVEGR